MFNAENLRTLLADRPFVPFRFILREGGAVEVPHRELVLVGRHSAIVGLLTPGATDMLCDNWATISYLSINRIEPLTPTVPS